MDWIELAQDSDKWQAPVNFGFNNKKFCVLQVQSNTTIHHPAVQ